MKTKVFLIGWIALMLPALASAQFKERKVRFAIGIQPHVNWIHADEMELQEGPVRLGIGAGCRVDYRFEKHYAFSVGLDWNQSGGNIIYNSPFYLDLTSGLDTLSSGTRITYKVQHLEIPIAFRIMMREIGYSTGFLELGLDPMFNLQASIDANENKIVNEPFQSGVNPINLAWHAGAGLNYSLGASVSLQFELFYRNTFLDVTRENNIRKPDNARINEIGINFGILF